MTLYDQIKSHFTIPQAYEDWKDYRQQLTNYLITQTNQVSLPLCFSNNTDMDSLLPTLAVIGAGACNDIDLNALLPHFSKITLIDYDHDAMEKALVNYGIANSPKIECIHKTLNGLTDSHYQNFCEHLQYYVQGLTDSFDPEEFEKYAISKVRSYFDVVKEYSIPLSGHSYDYICCFGVHSQLQAMFSYIYHVFEVNLAHMYLTDTAQFNRQFTQCLRDENSRFIPLFHDVLLSCAKQGVIFGFEQNRTTDHNPIEGAYQGLEDIRRRNPDIQEETLLWPFLPDNNIHYEMKLMKVII